LVISRTPYRISFLGGGTDYPRHIEKHGGAVLGTAIDKSGYICVSRFFSRLFDYSIRIAYRQVECVRSVDEIQHAPFRECLRHCGISSDVEINYAGELPSHSGLGSSSSFVVGLLNALYAFQARAVSPMDLALQAIEIEQEVLKESVGCQDQTFAAFGGLNLIEFRSAGDFQVHPVPVSPQRLEEFQSHLLVLHTGIKRRAEGVAANQVKRLEENRAGLLELRALADQGYCALTGNGSLATFGELLDRSWRLKREFDPCIANREIHSICEAGMCAGALGAKLLGAGGGGCMLFFTPPERRGRVRESLAHLEEIPVRINAPGSRVIHQ